MTTLRAEIPGVGTLTWELEPVLAARLGELPFDQREAILKKAHTIFHIVCDQQASPHIVALKELISHVRQENPPPKRLVPRYAD